MFCTCILIPLLVGVICALLGYLLGRLLSNTNALKEKIVKLEAELNDCKSAKSKIEKVATLVSATPDLIPFNGDLAKAVFGKTIKENNLTIIEGIGPKIQELFHNDGIKTWKALSEVSIARCQDILDRGGSKFKIHNPGTWPKQAKLAYEGKWQELLDWQDVLDGGKE